MVWAESMASPSRISTSDGGMTTPSVLATAIVAYRSGVGTPLSRRRGLTARDSDSTLAPTDPFIGPSNAPSPRPETTGAAALLGKILMLVRNSAPAIGR